MLKKFGKIALAGLVALTLFISGGIVPDINTDNAIITRANNVTLLSIDKVNSYALLEKTGCIVDSKVDKIRLRFDLYLTENAPGYDNWHIRECTVDEKTGVVNYTGEWVNTPYLCVFVYVNADDTDDYIKQLAKTINIQAYNHYIKYETVRNVNLTLNPLLKAQYAIPDTSSKLSKDIRLFNIETSAETYTVKPDKTTISIGGNKVLLAADPIDIGDAAIDRSTYVLTSTYTYINVGNPANDTGIIDTIEIWAYQSMTGAKAGTFYSAGGSSYTNRDYESIGNVSSGSKQTFTGLDIDVSSGDLIGAKSSTGSIESDSSGYGGYLRYTSDGFGGTNTYTLLEDRAISLYGTGETLSETAPTITNSTGASNITHNSARLNGELTDDGGLTTSVTVYWGNNDGETTAGNWDNNYSLGNQSEGTFYHDVSLSGGTTYYYRYYASNSAGGAWASSTESFLTKPAAPTNVSATDGVHTDKVTITWTKSTGATGYKVYEGANLLDTLGDVATYDDTTAAAGVITPGTATASGGTSTEHVTLTVSGQSVANGTSRTYKVVATNATGDSPDSATDTGYRGTGSITYQWQRSAADSNASYSNIAGATTNPYNDTAGVVAPDGRYYKCIVSATGAANQTSTSDRGYKAIALTAPTITNSTGASNITHNSARLNGELTDDGGATTSVTVYWGDNDGVTTPGNWDNNYSLGNQSEGTFYHDVSSLPTGTTIYYRYYAENASGGDWADSTESFLTKPAAPTADTDTILPDGDGAVNNWTASSGTDRYAMVNDGSTSTYIYNTNSQYAFTTFIFARIGSTNYELASFAQNTSWSTTYRNSIKNPATNAAWTWDDVNNAQFGVAIATGATERSYQYFTFDATSGTGDIDYLRFKTTNMRYYTGVYYQARVAVFELEVNYTIPIDEPEIESRAASNIAATSARLNARVIDDGGEACEVRFGYGETTQTAVNFESYDTVTDWFGAYETGQSPYYDVSGLTQTTTYYFRVQIKNSAGTYTSGELDFTTDSSVGTPSNFNGAPSAASIYLSWTKGTGATNTVIRYSYSDYPTAVTEGIALYSGASTGYEHTGLTPGKNYYYSMWGESGGVYSASYVTLLVTTDASTGGDGAIDQPEQPGGWFQIPDDSALVNFEPFYSIVNDAADSWDMPRGTLWVTLGLFLSALISVSVFMIAKEILWAGIAGAGMIALITAIGILQLWMAAIIIIIIGMLMMRRA